MVACCSELILSELISDSLNLIKGEVGIATAGMEKLRKVNNREEAIIRYTRVVSVRVCDGLCVV